jgi:hypothetical protein
VGLAECEAGVVFNDGDMKLDGTRRSYQKLCFQTTEETRGWDDLQY